MALTTVNLKTTFDFTGSPKVFEFEDITDYAGQSIALTNVVGCIKVTAPSGTVVYNNTNFSSPDINPDVSLVNSTTIQLPLLADGTVQTGVYSIVYTVRVSATTLDPAYDVTVTKTYNLTYIQPSASLEISANLVTPLMTSTDTTNYTVTTNSGSVTPTITRVHTLYYPGSTGASPVAGTGQTLTTSTIYTQANATLQYSSTCVASTSYTLGSDFYLVDEITGYAYYDLAASPTLCELYCGINTLYNNWQDNKGTVMGDNYKRKFDAVMDIAQLMAIAIDCGRADDIAAFAAEMKKIGGFTDDCACSSGETPTLVTGLGGGGEVVVQAGSGITVSSGTSGTTTTYTVALSAANIAKLTAQYNSVVAAGSGVSVSSSTAADGTITYTITNTNLVNQLSFSVTVTPSPGNTPTVTNSFYYLYGTKFQNATVENANTVLGDYQTLNNEIVVDDFFSGASSNYTIQVGAVEYAPYYAVPTIAADPVNLPSPYRVVCVDKNSTDFKLQIVDADGLPLTGTAVDASIASIVFNVTIIG